MIVDAFYLGVHEPSWLTRAGVPLFVSHRRLARRSKLPHARAAWALDSGGFTELHTFGEWRTTAADYVRAVRRYASEVGLLRWVAPMDWMVEPSVLTKTGLTVVDHQRRTVTNFLLLQQALGGLVVPVLQGWTLDDYLRCAALYEVEGVSLADQPTVGLGSVCRRQNMAEAGRIVRRLDADGLRLHGFGVKTTGLRSFGDVLASADSMAWSYNARRNPPLPGCTHKSCANCLRFALRWRQRTVVHLQQLRLGVIA